MVRKENNKKVQTEEQLLCCISKKMENLKTIIEQIADSNIPVLIRVEAGTGKEGAARAIHAASPRCSKPFIKLSDLALPDRLLECELFGYEKGAFKGAARRKLGKLELANHSTIFFDRIGDFPEFIQAKLQQLLQDGKFKRIGGDEEIKVDVRVIAASDKDLDKAVQDGAFREDLFYSLNVVTINIPPLRARKEDIPFLVMHFIEKFNRQYNRTLKKISEETMQRLMAYNWPGNVKELEGLVKRAVVLGNEDAILTRIPK
jgi:two-component system response regulator AtoC